jgi:hypothetical protein
MGTAVHYQLHGRTPFTAEFPESGIKAEKEDERTLSGAKNAEIFSPPPGFRFPGIDIK